MIEHLSEQEQLRRQSLAALRELGINPYPAERFDVSVTARELNAQFDANPEAYQQLTIAGRMMSRRIMG
ncbi:MAG: lysine--tRNA ligase, partial [Alistipes sp.]|nr:lysine--tRNA ligase [Alistipes sp.]